MGQEVGTGWETSQALRGPDMAENLGPALHTAHAEMKDRQAVVPDQFFSPSGVASLLLLTAQHGSLLHACTDLAFPS